MKTNKPEPFIATINGVETLLIADQVCVSFSVVSHIVNNEMVTSLSLKCDLYTKVGNVYVYANLEPRILNVTNLFTVNDYTIGEPFYYINDTIESFVLAMDDENKWNKNL